MAAAIEPKYEGKVSAKVRGTAEQVWPFLEDFCSVDKLLPGVTICSKLEGVYAQPGLIRYCQLTEPDGDQTTKKWINEKLIAIDPIRRSLSYKITENNMGFHSYVATLKVNPINDNDQHGCEIEWSFITGPIDGWKFEDFLAYMKLGVETMAESVGKAL